MKYTFLGVLLIVVGVLLLAVPHWIFPVCEFAKGAHLGSGTHMACYWVAQMEMGMGVFMALCGVLFLSARDKRTKYGIALVSMFAALLNAAIPTFIIGICLNPAMACHQTLPALLQASGLGFLAMLFAVYSLRKDIRMEKTNPLLVFKAD